MLSAAADTDKTCNKSNKTRCLVCLYPVERINNQPAVANCENGSNGAQKKCHEVIIIIKVNISCENNVQKNTYTFIFLNETLQVN